LPLINPNLVAAQALSEIVPECPVVERARASVKLTGEKSANGNDWQQLSAGSSTIQSAEVSSTDLALVRSMNDQCSVASVSVSLTL